MESDHTGEKHRAMRRIYAILPLLTALLTLGVMVYTTVSTDKWLVELAESVIGGFEKSTEAIGEIDNAVVKHQMAVKAVADALEDADLASALIKMAGDLEEIARLVGPPRSIGTCQAGQLVGFNQFCEVVGKGSFYVMDLSARSPWDRADDFDLNPRSIKVDDPEPRLGWEDVFAFQASIESETSDWRIHVMGLWEDLGDCERGLSVRPGQFCKEPNTNKSFLVYATDEEVPGDERPLYLNGYGILFWKKDDKIPDPGDNGLLRPDKIVCSTTTGQSVFLAVRQAKNESHHHLDKWEIKVATQNDEGDMICEPLPE